MEAVFNTLEGAFEEIGVRICIVVENYLLLQQRHAVQPSRQLAGRTRPSAGLAGKITKWQMQIQCSEAGPKMLKASSDRARPCTGTSCDRDGR